MAVLERGRGGARPRTRGWLRVLLLLTLANLPSCAPDTRGPGEVVRDDAGRAVRIAAGPLGLVGDVLGGADGRLYVLDVGQKQLSLLPRGLGNRYVVGRAGHGPGELADPVALAETRQGRLFLLDRGNQRVEVYRTVVDSLEHVTSLPLDFVPEDACTLGERLFVLGPRGGYLVHEVSPGDGRVLRSLVSDPASRDPMLSPHRAAGFVQCGPGDELTVLPLLRPEISRYSAATGQRLGRLRIPRYRGTARRA